MTDRLRRTRRVFLLTLYSLCGLAGVVLLVVGMTIEPPRPPQPPRAAALPTAHAPSPTPAPTPTASPQPSTLARSVPVGIEIPAIDLKADLLSQGITDRGELAVPAFDQAMKASWYNLGPSPGEPGSAIIVGHVDSEKTGPAVFFYLGKLKQGDVIKVAREDGTTVPFKVDEVSSYLKSEFPAKLVYGGDDRATLRLVTCGGEFDKRNKNYLSNVVVFATYAP